MPSTLPFRFGVLAEVTPTMSAWRDQARMAESLGYSTLYISDHLDAQFGPLVAATVAAEATSTLHVGFGVLNNDLRNPVVVAKEIATLGLAAEERVEVGFGAGWLRSDYEQAGIAYDKPAVRVDRLAESLAVMKTLWSEGKSTYTGTYYTVQDARCDPRPALPPRVIVGGGSKRILTVAAEHADTVGVNTSLASGVKGGDLASQASFEHFDRCLSWVRDGAGDRFNAIELQIVAFATRVVASQRAAARTATMLGFPGEDALELPIVLIGTEDELCERLLKRRERWGFTNIVIGAEAMESFAPVVARLAGS
ncbi:LLM class F420-dependent oxidoreductase [Mycobacterium cookii]|uniref:LLM class F420-dependent oxidoreductase n=1 Tax=Mycobacterium cookii TaxID=1775 RepID=A0A7I7KYV0_9MYCO|nr:TIGR03621 family F420-dependent LLM class oxidoreductase [Mycobacterium cookii]MCV7331685.1 TIGR03621 family F420-dependent LLM class oxidoreductase [Mycobacterium cookii]BBX46984.1 LLM class F420-dependent oxidoreductase [Mycobacterium cookii]